MQTIWIKNLIFDLCVVDSIFNPLRIYYDNKSTMLFPKNNKCTKRSKHLEITYLKVKDFVKNNDIMVGHIDTNNMIADPLIKGLRHVVFNKHVKSISVLGSFDVLG